MRCYVSQPLPTGRLDTDSDSHHNHNLNYTVIVAKNQNT